MRRNKPQHLRGGRSEPPFLFERVKDSSEEKQKPMHLLIFIPEGNRKSKTIPVDIQDRWVVRLLKFCANLFIGATAYGRGVGVWKKSQRSRIQWDRVTVIESWIDPRLSHIRNRLRKLVARLRRMRMELNQDAVGFLIDGEWHSTSKRKKARKNNTV